MAFDYAKSAATAQRLLANFGQTVTLSREVAGSYDPVTGETTGGGVETQTCFAVLLDFGLADSGAEFSDSTMIKVGDKKILMEAKGLLWVPDVLTKLTDARGKVWQLATLVKDLDPASDIKVMLTFKGTK